MMQLMKGGIKAFTGNANKKFALDVCKSLRMPLGDCEVKTFSDGEIAVNINESVRGYDIYLIQPTCPPVNNNIMESLILIDAFKRASAGRINAVIPYYGYARQDRKTRGRDPITAKLIANLFERAGADRIITMDLHAGQIQGYFDIPVDHLMAAKTLANYFSKIIKENPGEEFVVASPDLGGVTRARKFADFLHTSIVIIEKFRPRPNVSEVMNIIGDIEGKNVIIIDDIIDTAGTITNAVDALKARGAKKVYITATHGLFSGPAYERIQKSDIEKCVVTDTIPLKEGVDTSKIEVISVAPYFARVIRRINNDESVSVLFDAEGI